MFMASVALGGCGIWSTHFVGVNAWQLTADGVELEMFFEPVLTFFSLFSAIAAVFGGLLIASKDPFFVYTEASRRTELLTASLKKEAMGTVVNKESIRKKIKVSTEFVARLSEYLYFF